MKITKLACRRLLVTISACLVMTGVVQAMEFMPVSQVRTGMTGHADTVIEGNTISQFNVKVLGVMKDRGPSGDLILAQVSGPVIDQTGGIVHGMSGSPVYIDGKLVGAIAYGWGFADARIGMITPIEQMVKLWNIPYQKEVTNPWKDQQLIPLGTPLMAYGFDKASLDYMKSKMTEYNYVPYETAAASGDDVKQPLKAGGSVAALLVDGDLKLGAIGTVTYVDKDKMVAFGHPFLKRGSVGYFMHNAYIFTVVKSVDSGFKVGSMGAEVGTVTEDRGAGIAGIEGQYNAGIPVKFIIRDEDTGKIRNSYVKVIDANEMTPTLVATSFYSFLNKTLDRTGEGTSTVDLTITPRNQDIPVFKRINMFHSNEDIAQDSVDETYKILDSLMNNRFRPYDISSMQIEANVMKQSKVAMIADAQAGPLVVAPGDTIYVDVVLEPYRDKPVTKEIFYTVPKDQPLGKATLEVRGGGVIPLPYLFAKQKYHLTDEIIHRLQVYKDFNDYYKYLRDDDTNNEIVVQILDPQLVVGIEDMDLSAKPKIDGVESNPIPGQVKPEKTAGALNAINLDETKDIPEAKVATNYVVKGDGQFEILVTTPEKRDKALAKQKREQAKLLAEKASKDTGADTTTASSDTDTTDTDGSALTSNGLTPTGYVMTHATIHQ